MKVSFLYGTRLSTLWRLLRAQRFRVQFRALPSLMTHVGMAACNSLLARTEPSYIPQPVRRPTFILGHWRSGTTHLHNLMTQDGTFAAPTTFEAAFPHIFLRWEEKLSPLFNKLGPGERLMDRMALTMQSVQEEEIGLASLGAPSSYLAIHFPADSNRYQRFVSFREATEKDQAKWKQALAGFIEKVSAKHSHKPLILKSPAHTARVRLLLEMYPDARFIHIHRHPFETIRSTLHLYDAWFQMANFQSLKELKAAREQHVLNAYEEVHRCWLEDQVLIPPDRLKVIAFEQLKSRPMETLHELYSFLEAGNLDKKILENYLGSIRSYRQNTYDPLSEDMKREIRERMDFVFEAFGYK